ncbi:MAG: 16S rRNA (guanine(527)-N(7))-methyltransferase RsmG [Gammaproteobacteria bacterium]|nr:16S rRNA (guanine(527)-N(7))-methyltransferase RsmG [Gammaproteobacteria bacterium]
MSAKFGGGKNKAGTAGLRVRLLAGAQAMNAPLTEAGADKLLEYLRLLDKWNKRFSLSGVSGIGEMLDRHVLDSLSVASRIGGETIVDAGSGAGLPGIPLAVLFPCKHFVLVDSNGKKARFLFQAKLDLDLTNVSVEHCRIEDYGGPADLVVCRALATLAECAAKTQHILSRGATLLAMKGRHPGSELARLPDPFTVDFMERVHVPGASNRHVVGIATK